MKRLWKKPAVKISAAVVIVVGFALLGLWIWSLKPPPAITFKFLNGRNFTMGIEHKPNKSPWNTTTQIYSFEENYNDVRKVVEAELLPLGFAICGELEGTYLPSISIMQSYQLPGDNDGESVTVSIRDRQRYVVYSTPQSSDYSSPDRYGFHYSTGWVTVEIVEKSLRLWPPQHLLYRLLWKLRPPAKTTRPQVRGSGAKQ